MEKYGKGLQSGVDENRLKRRKRKIISYFETLGIGSEQGLGSNDEMEIAETLYEVYGAKRQLLKYD